METPLWSQLLRECSKKSEVLPPSTCVFVGDIGCGKRSLIEKICSSSSSSSNASASSSSSSCSGSSGSSGSSIGDENNSHLKEIIGYNFFDVEEGFVDSVLRVNVFSFSDATFDSAFQVISRAPSAAAAAVAADSSSSSSSSNNINNNKNNNNNNNNTNKSNYKEAVAGRVLFMIGVDLSKSPDECVASLKRWLLKTKKYAQQYHDAIGASASAEAKEALMTYVRSARTHKGSFLLSAGAGGAGGAGGGALDSSSTSPSMGGGGGGRAEGESTSSSSSSSAAAISDELVGIRESSISMFGVPIVIVACKSDILGNEEGHSARVREGQLREACLEVGAALIFTSSQKSSNCAKMRKYLSHRLYPEAANMELKIENELEAAFVPSGFDTPDMIFSATGFRGSGALELRTLLEASANDEASSSSPSSSSSSSSSGAAAAVVQVELEDEQEWLGGLQTYINQWNSTGGALVSGGVMGTSGSSSSGNSSSSSGSSSSTSGGLGVGGGAGSSSSTTSGASTAAKGEKKTKTSKSAGAKKGDDVDTTADFFNSLLTGKK